jgi:hypothetical protein
MDFERYWKRVEAAPVGVALRVIVANRSLATTMSCRTHVGGRPLYPFSGVPLVEPLDKLPVRS